MNLLNGLFIDVNIIYMCSYYVFMLFFTENVNYVTENFLLL